MRPPWGASRGARSARHVVLARRSRGEELFQLTDRADPQAAGEIVELRPDAGLSEPSGRALVENPAGYRHISSERSTSRSTSDGRRVEVRGLSGRKPRDARLRLIGGTPQRLLDGRTRRRTRRARPSPVRAAPHRSRSSFSVCMCTYRILSCMHIASRGSSSSSASSPAPRASARDSRPCVVRRDPVVEHLPAPAAVADDLRVDVPDASTCSSSSSASAGVSRRPKTRSSSPSSRGCDDRTQSSARREAGAVRRDERRIADERHGDDRRGDEDGRAVRHDSRASSLGQADPRGGASRPPRGSRSRRCTERSG